MTITDMEAGVEVLSRGTPRASDVLLIVTEPYYKSLETATKVKAMAADLGIPHVYVVANKVRTPVEQRAIESFCEKQGLDIIATIPDDDSFVEAAMMPTSPMDHAPEATGVQAIVGLADKLKQTYMN